MCVGVGVGVEEGKGERGKLPRVAIPNPEAQLSSLGPHFFKINPPSQELARTEDQSVS